MALFDNDKLLVGIELGNEFAQLSYCTLSDENVNTVSSVTGALEFNIPLVLCKRNGVNQWFYGREALEYSRAGQGVLVGHLLSKARTDTKVTIEEREFEPVALLALFIKRVLGLLSSIGSVDKIAGIMITCDSFDENMLGIMNEVTKRLNLKNTKVFFQSHTESFYDYMIHQEEELWNRQSVLFDYDDESIKIYRMECNQNTTPIVAYIEEQLFSISSFSSISKNEEERAEELRGLDREFLSLSKAVCKEREISSVYLIGDGFNDEWMNESTKFLCEGRRVFAGNNLFSKGACFGALDRINPNQTSKSHVFLGNDKLKSNIGMKMSHGGMEGYFPILDAGINWFEANSEFDFYLLEEPKIELVITSLVGRGQKPKEIILEGLTSVLGHPGITRMHMNAFLKNENLLCIKISDCGFGQINLSTGYKYEKDIEI